ncbi:hypothetical protein L4D09_28065 [Photobacterium makurazakiensis]|uniref:hypothetical protein n=1 Tax=Photobacterium makurazakiensis TaxID=2910234 RepID=UPI003D151FAA
MSILTSSYATAYGTVTLKPRHYNRQVNDFVIELKLTPPNLWGWGVTATFPAEMESKITPEFAIVWASEAIGKLV